MAAPLEGIKKRPDIERFTTRLHRLKTAEEPSNVLPPDEAIKKRNKRPDMQRYRSRRSPKVQKVSPQSSSVKSSRNIIGKDDESIIETALREGLCNMESRGFILLTEVELCSFVNNRDIGDSILLPPMSSYHRLLVHNSAERFAVHSSSIGLGNSRRTKLSKREESIVPILRVKDMLVQKENDNDRCTASLEEFGDAVPENADELCSRTYNIADSSPNEFKIESECEVEHDLENCVPTTLDWKLILSKLQPSQNEYTSRDIPIGRVTTDHILEVYLKEDYDNMTE
eukprot:1005789_1